MKRKCQAAIEMNRELEADKATESYHRTRSHRAYERMRVKRIEALKFRSVRAGAAASRV